MVLTRVGILGGTFDPVHRGHLEIARKALEVADLQRVLLIPAGAPRLKSSQPAASADHRMAMLRLAVGDTQGLVASDIELQRPGSTKSVDTLRLLRQEYGEECQLFFIMGVDVLAGLEHWICPGEVVRLASIIAFSRPGYTGFDWADFYHRNPYADGRVQCIEASADLSASEVRSRIAARMSVVGLLQPEVEDYIRARGLYGAVEVLR